VTEDRNHRTERRAFRRWTEMTRDEHILIAPTI
jgi:hypothetical protein